jgi:hypothetical protein
LNWDRPDNTLALVEGHQGVPTLNLDIWQAHRIGLKAN